MKMRWLATRRAATIAGVITPETPDCLIVTGIPGAGKSTVTRLVAERLPRSARLDGDFINRLIVSDHVRALGEPADEAARQVELCNRNLCTLANNFSDAGFTPVIDWVIPSLSRPKQDWALTYIHDVEVFLTESPRARKRQLVALGQLSTYSCDCATEYGDICTSVRAGRPGSSRGHGGGGEVNLQHDCAAGHGPVFVHVDLLAGFDVRPVSGSEGNEADSGPAARLQNGHVLNPEPGDTHRSGAGG